MSTYIIAEAGVNHNGDLQLAKELIYEASKAGADAVKFQSFRANHLASPDSIKANYQQNSNLDETQNKMLSRLELTTNQHYELANHCNDHGISFLSTAFGIPELNMLVTLGVGIIKVASGEITNLPLLIAMASCAKKHKMPIYMSTGMTNLGEIESAFNIFLEAGINRNSITLLHCVSSYPAPEIELNLHAIQTLRHSFGCSIGYSDHSLGIIAPIAAVVLGATVIEKHITLNTRMEGPDHASSLNPKEFSEMVTSIRKCEKMLGDGFKVTQPSEQDTKYVARRSVRAAEFIKKNSVLTEDNLICQRPADGLSPMLIQKIIGTKAIRDFNAGELISY
ncbi:N-acetylneuraminate synthase [Prochlorococcus sp. MIT 1306]|uniref:N-acetylneuraminate synthase n=1 Tax=Prochlorococcus sp. MIT 1306 TaxID=1799667 RepID=UPI0007B3FA32|nr:N-acetylneuraminate synthase [Prochlorococcus sp. MIT 1306]KZR61082.1 N,N'-diacetyllegionaminic acid synthase [Prochlorococcus sp. MIT 1306]